MDYAKTDNIMMELFVYHAQAPARFVRVQKESAFHAQRDSLLRTIHATSA